MKRTFKILIGKKMRKTAFGLVGCSHGMYARGGYNNWMYGIKGIFGIQRTEAWGFYRDTFDD